MNTRSRAPGVPPLTHGADIVARAPSRASRPLAGGWCAGFSFVVSGSPTPCPGHPAQGRAALPARGVIQAAPRVFLGKALIG